MLSGSISEQKSVFRPRTPCDPISRAGGAWSAPGRRRGRPQGPSPARWRSRHASGERRRKGRHLRDPRDLALRLAPSLPPPTEDLEPARGRGPGEGNEPAPGGEGAGRREGVPIKPPGIGVLNLAGLPRTPLARCYARFVPTHLGAREGAPNEAKARVRLNRVHCIRAHEDLLLQIGGRNSVLARSPLAARPRRALRRRRRGRCGGRGGER
jgi:hypothetical protein